MDNRYDYSDSGTHLDLIRSDNPPASASEEETKLYVAVGGDAKENESTLLWAARNSGGRKLSIVHVYQQVLSYSHQEKESSKNELTTLEEGQIDQPSKQSPSGSRDLRVGDNSSKRLCIFFDWHCTSNFTRPASPLAV